MTAGNVIVRPDALDYLSGLSIDPARLPPESSWHTVPRAARRLESVRGIGFSDTTSPDDSVSAFPAEAMIAGLAGERIPFAFQVIGQPGGVRFEVGTWHTATSPVDRRHGVLTSLLDGTYPMVDRVEAQGDEGLARFPMAGIAHGVPAGEVHNGHAPWDRLLRGVRGTGFAVVVLAEPVEPERIARLRDVALEDLRAASAAQNGRSDLPLTRAYTNRMDELVASLDRAMSTGGWRTGVYLLGDETSYWRLAAAWRGVFADGERPFATLRVVPCAEATRLAAAWALPDTQATAGPRRWRHPFLSQTLLDTKQLASYVHFPRNETAGFSIRPAPSFAVSRATPRPPARVINIGDVLEQRKKTGGSYLFDLDQLTRHAFVAGLTGSGKTNTVMGLLTEIAAADTPFLVIEPAKTEYRELLGRPGIGSRLRVFTLGREQVAPLRINPFEVPTGIDVSTHLDLVKAVFMASFAMWIPLPQVLEQCLVQLYSERGWDFTTGGVREGAASNLPTLGDLAAAVERIVPTLGYKEESTQEITASLTTRINALRRGTRGLMLDVEKSIPMSELLSAPTVIELEGLGDDADKAFVMGLLLVRLYEHRRAEYSAQLAAAAAAGRPAPRTGELSHVVVIEEAHRLLAKSDKATDAWHADPQGAFADTFSQMLSEVRAYGQGMIIADQVPVRLAPDVVKNTNLKIAHRLVAGDDREAMAAAMAMDPTQSTVLSTLPVGHSAVFSEGDHSPVMVAVRKAKGLDNTRAVDDLAVARAMATWQSTPEVARYFSALPCAGVCRSSSDCADVRDLAEDPDARLLGMRLFNTGLSHVDGLDVVWPDVAAFVATRTSSNADLPVHAFAIHAMHLVLTRRATQAGWRDVAPLSAHVRAALAERAGSTETWLGATPVRRALLDTAAALMRRSHDPYPLCASVCPDGTCWYRDSVADVLVHPRHASFPSDLAGQAESYVVQAAGYAANDITAADDRAAFISARWRAVACVAQVKFCSNDRPRESAAIVKSALSTAGWNIEER